MVTRDIGPSPVGADGVTRVGLRRLYTTEVVTGVGSGIFWVALVAALAPDASFEVLLTAAVIARIAPRALLSYLAGRILDTTGVRTVLLTQEAARGVIMLALGWAVALDVDPWVLVAGVLLAYFLAVPAHPAVAAALPRIAGEAHLATAAATTSTIRRLTAFVGPLVGVLVVQVAIPSGFVVNGLCYLLSAVLLASIRRSQWPEGHRRERVGQGPGRGRRRPSVPGLAGVVVLVGGMYVVRGAEYVLHILVVTELIGAPAEQVGYVNGGVGLGAVVAAVIAARVVDRTPATLSLWVSILLTAASTAALAVSGSIVGASATVVLVGVGMVLFEVVTVVTMQRISPEEELASVFGAIGSASGLGMLLGALLVPGLVAIAGVSGALVVVAVGLVVVAASTTRALARADESAQAQRVLLAPTVDALRRTALFADAPRAALERLAAATDEVSAPRGTPVVVQGEPADALYLVRTGDLEVVIDGERVNVIGTDGWFGEIGLIDRTSRTATVRTTTSALLWRIPGPVFLDTLTESVDRPQALVEGMAARTPAGRGRQSTDG